MNLVIDVSVFIDRLFIYDEERSLRAHNLFRLVDDRGLNIFEPSVFGIELASQLVRRKPRSMAEELYNEIIDKVVIIDDIDYDLLLDIALSTACRAIDTYYIAAAHMLSSILVSADKIMINNARKYGVEAYYIHDINDYNSLISRIGRDTN